MPLDWKKLDSSIEEMAGAGFGDDEIEAAVAELAAEEQGGPLRSGFKPLTQPEQAPAGIRRPTDREEGLRRSRDRHRTGAEAARADRDATAPSVRNFVRDTGAALGDVADGLTFGRYRPARDAALDLLAPGESQKLRADEAQADPNQRAWGKGVGLGLGGVRGIHSGVSTAIDAGARAVAPRFAATLTGRMGASVATGAALTAAEKDASMEDVGGAAAMSAGVPLVARALQGTLDLGRKGIHTAAPWVKKLAGYEESGIVNPKAMKAGGKQAVTDQAFKTVDDIVARDQEMADEALTAHRRAVDPHRSRAIGPDDVRAPMRDLVAKGQTSDGVNIREAAPGVAKRVAKTLGLDPTVDDAIKLRQALGDEAGFGAPAPTAEQLANRGGYGAVRQGIRQAAPEVGVADDALTASKRRQARRNDILIRKEDGAAVRDLPEETAELTDVPSVKRVMRPGDEITAAKRVQRIGDQTEEGRFGAKYLDELAEQDPAFRRALQELEARKAFEATRFASEYAPQGNLHQNTSLGGKMQLLSQQGNALGRRADIVLRGMGNDARALGDTRLRVPLLELLQAGAARRERR